MEFKSDKAKEAAERYIKLTYPHGCPPKQGIDIKLAFYAGIFEMFCQISEISAAYDEDDAADRIKELSDEVEQRALKLNDERKDL